MANNEIICEGKTVEKGGVSNQKTTRKKKQKRLEKQTARSPDEVIRSSSVREEGDDGR